MERVEIGRKKNKRVSSEKVIIEALKKGEQIGWTPYWKELQLLTGAVLNRKGKKLTLKQLDNALGNLLDKGIVKRVKRTRYKLTKKKR